MSSQEILDGKRGSKLAGWIAFWTKKMMQRPVYRILLYVLGCVSFLIAAVRYRTGKTNSRYEQTRERVEQELEQAGERDALRDEIHRGLVRKAAFFEQQLTEAELNSRTEQLLSVQFAEMVDQRLARETAGSEVRRASLYTTFCELLQGKAFLTLSLIVSLPMYLLMLVYANAYSKYILERLVMMVFVVFGVTFLVFTILYFSPSDPAVNILGEHATEAQYAEFRRVYGLDQPYIVRLLQQFKGLITFDLGKSYVGSEDIAFALSRRFPITLELTFLSMVISIIIAIPAGIVSAMRQYSAFDYIFMFIALVGLSIPVFWLGLLLILTFSINLGWLPATFSAGNPLTLLMPAFVLGACNAASLARMTRSSMLEIKNQEFVMTAKAKGLSHYKVVMRHILGNAWIPIITMAGLLFGELLGGSAVIEKVFNVNGIGSLIVDKQFVPDVPVVLAGVVYVAIVISLVNLLVDIVYAFLDPRIKSSMKNY